MTEAEHARRLIMRGGWSTAAGFAVRLGARLLFLFIAGRLFGVALFGAYVIALAVVEAAVTVAGLGTKRLLFQWLDEGEASGGRKPIHLVLDSAVLVTLAGSVLAALAMGGVLLLPGSVLSGNSATAIFLLAPTIVGQVLLDIFLAATRWKHVIRYEVIGRSVVQAYAGVIAAIAAYYAGLTAHGLILSYWAGTLAALAYALMGVRSCFGGLALRGYRVRLGWLAGKAPAIAINSLTDFVDGLYTRLDLYLVGILLGEGPAGIYGMARQVSIPIRQVRQSFDGLLIPVVTRTLSATGPAETGKAIASASRLILVIQLPLLIGLVPLGLPLLDWFGPAFALGYWALLILAAGEAIQSAFGIGDLIFTYRDPRLGLRITAASVAIGAALGFLLIPALGITGAALSVFLSYCARAVMRGIALRARFGLKVSAAYNAGPLVSAAAGAGVAMLVMRSAFVGDVAIHAAAAVAGLAVFAATLASWLKLAGESLALKGFVAGLPVAETVPPGQAS